MLVETYSQICEKNPYSSPEGLAGIKSNVIFGSPRQDCNGTGICQIASFDGSMLQGKNKNCRFTVGYVQPHADGNGLSIKFRKTDLCCRLYANHFYKGSFQMTDACHLSAEVRKSFGIKHSSLKPGTYKVQESNGWVQVDIILM